MSRLHNILVNGLTRELAELQIRIEVRDGLVSLALTRSVQEV